MQQDRRLYWFDKAGVLIFKPGYVDPEGKPMGQIHVYQHKESLPADQLADEIKKYGYPMSRQLSA